MHALNEVAAGGTAFPPEHAWAPEDEVTPQGPELNAREAQILELLAKGLTNQEIGEQMYLSTKTIKNYVSSVLIKLGVRHRTEAALHARRSRPTPALTLSPAAPPPSTG